MAQKAIGINIPAAEDPNFTADDHAALFHALAGWEGILDFDITCTRIDDNTVRLTAGDVLVEGHQHRVEGGTTQDLTVVSGTAGYYRHDLVVAEFERRTSDEDSDVLQFAVVQGTPTTGTPDDPALTVGDINIFTNTTRQVKLFRLPISGTTLGTPEQVAHNIEGRTGWIPFIYAGSRGGDTTLLLNGDVTGYLSAGDPIKFYQQGVAKYATARSLTWSGGSTSVILTMNGSYVVSDAYPVDQVYYSKSSNPQGYSSKKFHARAYLSAAQENLVSTDYTKVLLDTESYDPGLNFDSYKFTAPVSGYYLIHGQVTYTDVVADKYYSSYVYVDGSVSFGNTVHAGVAASISALASGIQYLAADQYVELYARHGAGVNTVDVVGSSTFTYLEVMLMTIV